MEDNILTDLEDYHVAILVSRSSAYHSTALYFPLISCLFLLLFVAPYEILLFIYLNLLIFMYFFIIWKSLHPFPQHYCTTLRKKFDLAGESTNPNPKAAWPTHWINYF